MDIPPWIITVNYKLKKESRLFFFDSFTIFHVLKRINATAVCLTVHIVNLR
jgi:hypothetical protein